MSIPFGFSVPLEPGVYVEVDNSKAGATAIKSKVLVLGQRLASGSVEKDTLTFVPSTAAAKEYFGLGSMIARSIEILKAAYPGAEVWAIAQDDDATGVQASGTITVTGTATASGTIYLYIAGQLVKVPVTVGDVQNDIADAINNYLSDAAYNPDYVNLPVTSSVAANVVTLTAKHKGSLGNAIDVRVNYRGAAAGEVLPAGVSIAIVAMSGGTTEPDLTATITAMLDNEYDTIISPYITAANLEALKTEMARRWSATVMVYGHICSAVRNTYSNLITFGSTTSKNDPHITFIGYDDSPTPPWEVAAALGALTAEKQMDATNATLALGFTGLRLYGMLPPAPGSEFSISERDILLHYGIATFKVSGGACYLSRARTNYQKDASGAPDTSFFDQRTLAILMRIIRLDKAAFAKDFSGAILVEDATRVGGGQAVCSPAIARGWFVGRYKQYEKDGLVTNVDKFIENLVIEVDASNPNQLNVLYPPVLSGWLAVTAIKNQFYLS